MLIPILVLLVLIAGQPAANAPTPARQESAPAAEKTFYQDVAWSRDGRHIAFTAMRHAGEKEMRSGIYVMRSDGTEAARVTDEATVAFYVSMSPDGKRVAYAGRMGEKQSACPSSSSSRPSTDTRSKPSTSTRSTIS